MLDLSNLVYRDATPADAGVVLDLVRGLAEYEGELHKVHMNHADCEKLLREGPAKALLVYDGEKPVGMALYFFNFSSWTGSEGLFLEDLFVQPEARNCGLGQILFRKMAEIAVARGCRRMEWNVLTENEQAKVFYTRFGGFLAEGWETWRLEGQDLKAAGVLG